MEKLFLLSQDFIDGNIDNNGICYYCMDCAMIEGILKYYPELEKVLEINYVDFKRPRKAVVELIGDDNQGCPVLIIENNEDDGVDKSYFKSFGNTLFINSSALIAKYLSEKYGIGIAHP